MLSRFYDGLGGWVSAYAVGGAGGDKSLIVFSEVSVACGDLGDSAEKFSQHCPEVLSGDQGGLGWVWVLMGAVARVLPSLIDDPLPAITHFNFYPFL